MKLDELEKEMKVVIKPKPQPKSAGFVPSGGPAQVLEGEVLNKDEEFEDDIEYSIMLHKKVRNLLFYLADPKLVTIIQSQDRKEIVNQIAEIDVFLDAISEDDDENILYCPQCEFNMSSSASLSKFCPDCNNHPDLMTQEEFENNVNDPPDNPAYQQELNLDVPDMNKGNCKNLIHSSCVMAIKDTQKWCSGCKAWYAAFYYEGELGGVLANDGDLTSKDLKRLNMMCGDMGVDI